MTKLLKVEPSYEDNPDPGSDTQRSRRSSRSPHKRERSRSRDKRERDHSARKHKSRVKDKSDKER